MKRLQFLHMMFRLQAAELELNKVMSLLREKQKQLADVEAVIMALEEKFNKSLLEKKILEDEIQLTANRLVNAGRLNVALGDEQSRWEQQVEVLKMLLTFLSCKVNSWFLFSRVEFNWATWPVMSLWPRHVLLT